MPDDAPMPSPRVVLQRRAIVAPSPPVTVDAEARTVIGLAATWTPQRQYVPSYGGEIFLSLDRRGADLRRVAAGTAPLLLDHVAATDSAVGMIIAAEPKAEGLEVVLRFATVPTAEAVFQRVREGSLGALSVGFEVIEPVRIGDHEGLPHFRAARWVLLECSLVAVPRDPATAVRSIQGPAETEVTMTEAATAPADTAPLPLLRSIAGRAGLGADWVLSQLEAGATELAARDAAIDAVAARQAAPVIRSAVSVGNDHSDPAAITERMADAIVARFTRSAPPERAREFAGLSLASMGRELLRARGDRGALRLGDAEVIARSLTTSDFPNLLSSTSARMLQTRLAANPGAARMICAPRTVRDFRSFSFIQFAGTPNLAEIAEGATIPNRGPDDRTETSRVRTFGRTMMWTRQALVNDDLDALTQVNLFANAVVNTEATEFVTMFATNGAGWGPTLADGLPLFHATHGNVATGAMGTAGISAARIVMRAQTDASNVLVAPTPRYVLVSPTNETAAEQALNDIAVVATGETNRPIFASRLEMALEPRLSGTPYFLFADPAEAPVLALVTLEAGGAPRITQHETADFDGIGFKLTHDFTIAPMGYVGAVRSTGA